MAAMMKAGIIVIGIVMILAGFLFHSLKKLTINFALFWVGLGVLLILTGVALPMWIWDRLFSVWQGIPFLCLCILFLTGGFAISVILSQLIVKNRELAMQVALLVGEKAQIELELGEASEQYEKTAVGY